MSSFLTPRDPHTSSLARIKEEINLESYKPIISVSPRSKSPRKMLAATFNSKPMLSKIGKHSSFPTINSSYQVQKSLPGALPKITDSQQTTRSYDLYNPDPTVAYLKEKYKLYLEWLSENSNEENQDLKLNWYNYEKTVYADENNSLRFLRNSKSRNSQEKSSYTCIDSSIKETLKSSNQNADKKAYHSSMSTYKSDLKVDEKVKEQARRRFSDIQTTKGHFIKVPNAFQRFAETPGRKHTLIKSKSVTTCNKGVQFEAVNSPISNNSTKLPSVYNTKQGRVVKPILKLQFSECSSYNDESMVQMTGSGRKSLKLPPIVGCSEDFYAVLKDLELEEKMPV